MNREVNKSFLSKKEVKSPMPGFGSDVIVRLGGSVSLAPGTGSCGLKQTLAKVTLQMFGRTGCPETIESGTISPL